MVFPLGVPPPPQGTDIGAQIPPLGDFAPLQADGQRHMDALQGQVKDDPGGAPHRLHVAFQRLGAEIRPFRRHPPAGHAARVRVLVVQPRLQAPPVRLVHRRLDTPQPVLAHAGREQAAAGVQDKPRQPLFVHGGNLPPQLVLLQRVVQRPKGQRPVSGAALPKRVILHGDPPFPSALCREAVLSFIIGHPAKKPNWFFNLFGDNFILYIQMSHPPAASL